VKAPIWDGPCKGVLNAARNILARPDWRPALVMVTSGFVGLLPAPEGRADPPDFHHAPRSAASLENPYRGEAPAAQAGGKLYALYCAACHGRSAEGTGNIPALAHGPVQQVPDGEVFWFITKGSNSGAMPSWASLPEQQRWQLVTYLKTLVSAPIAASAPVAAQTYQFSAIAWSKSQS
jgi:mono/diheme cytochrome c family protein